MSSVLDDIIAFLEGHDAGVFADYLRELKQELDEPRRIVLSQQDLDALGSGLGCVIRDGVAVYYD